MNKLLLQLILAFSLSANMNVNDGSFIEFVRFVANTSNINIIVDEDINTKFSLVLPKDFSSNDSLKILKSILRKNDLRLILKGSIYYIEKKFKETKNYYSIKLKYLLPDKIIPIIQNYHKDIVISKSKRTIIYETTYTTSKKIKNLVALLDKQVKSKKIKITLISYKNSDMYEYGINLDTEVNTETSDIGYKTLINALSATQSVSLALSSIDLGIYITAMQTDDIVDLKYSPTLNLFDNEKTDFTITQNIPYLSEDRSVNGANDIQSNNFVYKDVGSEIHIDKVAITDDAVYFHIDMKYEVILDNSLTPITAKRSINNYIKLKDGQTIMIAGITADEVRTNHREIPILSAIPYLGEIFKYKTDSKLNNTFTIFITNIDEDANKLERSEERLSDERTNEVK